MTQLKDTADKPILVFLGKSGDSSVRIANRQALGDDGISSLQKAEAAHQFNSVRIRNGVTVFSEAMLLDRARSLSGKGFDHSIAELQKGLHAINPDKYKLPTVKAAAAATTQKPAA